MKKILFLILLSLAVVLVPIMSTAEIREGSVEINPFAGYYFPSTEARDHGLYGLRIGYNLTKNWGVEGAFDHFVARAEMYHADVLYHFTPKTNFNPFIVGGIGNAFIREDTHNAFMGDIGLGFKYFLSDTVGLRFDARGAFTDFSSLVTTAGITFQLGGKVPKAAPVPPMPAPTPPPAPSPTPLPTPMPMATPPPAATPAPVKVILEDIHFEFDKATLTKAAEKILDDNIRMIRENPGIEVQIEGHACAHGPDDYNMALSERRANAVKEYLIKGGIQADRLTTIAYGETRLAMPEIPTPYNKESIEAKTNRRVHFEVIVR
ncbi:MAG: OmpA family protein [Candidatus Sulfobium sp.]|jgi:OOP family OmpA-OmpF porin